MSFLIFNSLIYDILLLELCLGRMTNLPYHELEICHLYSIDYLVIKVPTLIDFTCISNLDMKIRKQEILNNKYEQQKSL